MKIKNNCIGKILLIYLAVGISILFIVFSNIRSEYTVPDVSNLPTITIIDTDGSVYEIACVMTPQNGPGSYLGILKQPNTSNPKAINAQIKASNANGGYLAPGGTYYVPRAGAAPKSPSTPSTPKTETKKEELTCKHEYTSEVTKDPTCKEKGVTTFTCSKCGDTYTEDVDVTDTHTFDAEKEYVSKEATCTEEGESKKVCSVCGYEETSPIPKMEHKYVDEVTTKPTCTEKGTRTFTCELCGDSYTEDLDAIGHNEGDFEVTVLNGMFTDGEQIKKCTVCGEILETEVIPAKHPIWYLYCGIVIFIIILGVVVGSLVKRYSKK